VYLKELKAAQDAQDAKAKAPVETTGTTIVVSEVDPIPTPPELDAPQTVEIAASQSEAMDQDPHSSQNAGLNTPAAGIRHPAMDEVVAQAQDTPDVPTRFMEKKRLHWEGKTCA
jgi:hypothetical protein